ncbi:hypothetical protein Rs2_35120 [Raphanus sativus]|nr:hypothetical protein Rs2_35120 [Raphanus sativus]
MALSALSNLMLAINKKKTNSLDHYCHLRNYIALTLWLFLESLHCHCRGCDGKTKTHLSRMSKLLQCLVLLTWIITLQTGVRRTHRMEETKQSWRIFGSKRWFRMGLLYPQAARVKKVSKLCKKQIRKPKFMIIGHCDINYEKKAKLSNSMDIQRIEYYEKYLQSIHQAIKEYGV